MKHSHNSCRPTMPADTVLDALDWPVVLLESNFHVIAVNRSFFDLFGGASGLSEGQPFFGRGAQPWDMPVLRLLAEKVVSGQEAAVGLEVELELAGKRRRTILANASGVHDRRSDRPAVLIAFDDVTARRAAERDSQARLDQSQELLAQHRTLLQEMEHRVANSLQIMANILLVTAGNGISEETREELQAAHQRVVSVAQVQTYLHVENGADRIEIGSYLTKLGAGLAASMLGPHQRIAVEVVADRVRIESRQAVSIGLIVTELVTNAIKYAFRTPRDCDRILIRFKTEARGWRLGVSDNGSGRDRGMGAGSSGLGSAIVSALARQLRAETEEVSTDAGLSIEVTRFSPARRRRALGERQERPAARPVPAHLGPALSWPIAIPTTADQDLGKIREVKKPPSS